MSTYFDRVIDMNIQTLAEILSAAAAAAMVAARKSAEGETQMALGQIIKIEDSLAAATVLKSAIISICQIDHKQPLVGPGREATAPLNRAQG